MFDFNGDLGNVLDSFIIANRAAAHGKQVTMFVTFWGGNVIKRLEKGNVAKYGMERMFDIMPPNYAGQLSISKVNMSAQAQKKEVKILVCTISMVKIGIKDKKIIVGVDFGSVATYICDMIDANLNLFIYLCLSIMMSKYRKNSSVINLVTLLFLYIPHDYQNKMEVR